MSKENVMHNGTVVNCNYMLKVSIGFLQNVILNWVLKTSVVLLTVALAVCTPQASSAQLALPSIFSDHMVLQRNIPIPVWGTAPSQEEITVTFANHVETTNADVNGKWKLTLPSMEAGGPHKLKVNGRDHSIEIGDVMVGEVWLCSGQSNMEFPLERSVTAEIVVTKANYPDIRLFMMKKRVSMGNTPFSEEDIKLVNQGDFYFNASWEICTSETAAKFSAVAYFFGKILYETLNVPIGLIQNAVGGSPAQSWISKESLSGHPQLEYLVNIKDGETWHDQIGLNPWLAERSKQNLAQWFEQDKTGDLPHHPFEPGYLFETGIEPLIQFPIKGAIWYQGESNATHPDSYGPMIELMVRNWREAWGMGDFPFIYVQLPRISNRNRWPEFRDVQLQGLEIPNTAMAVSIDTGHPTDVHPEQKKVIGERLAAAALGKWYGLDTPYLGPSLSSWTRTRNEIKLVFKHAGNGLMVEENNLGNVFLEGYDETGSRRLTIKPAKIKVSANEVIIDIPSGLSLTTIKYAWTPYPDEPLLFNSYQLPASPFKIELPGNN